MGMPQQDMSMMGQQFNMMNQNQNMNFTPENQQMLMNFMMSNAMGAGGG